MQGKRGDGERRDAGTGRGVAERSTSPAAGGIPSESGTTEIAQTILECCGSTPLCLANKGPIRENTDSTEEPQMTQKGFP